MSEQRMPVGSSYDGPSGGLKKPSLWMASEDLGLGVEVVATIEDVLIYKAVKFDAGRVEDKVSAIRYVGREKEMILNTTNRKMLIGLFGMDTKKWRGERVAIYVDPKSKQVGGGTGPGLRLKAPPREEKRRDDASPLPAEKRAEAPPVAALADLPAGWEQWNVEERGMNRALKGTATFREWWKTLGEPARASIKPRMAEWQELAEAADAKAK